MAEEESVRTIVFCRQDSINNLFPSPLSVNTTENTEVQLARRTWTQSEFTRSESLLPFMESAGVCGSASCSRRPVWHFDSMEPPSRVATQTLVLSFPGSERLFHIASRCFYSWTSHQKSKRTARVNLFEKMGGNKASVVYWKESQIHTVLGAQLCCFDSTGTGPHPLATQLSQPYMCFPVSSLPNTMRWRRWQQLSLFFHNHWPTWPRNTVYWTPPRTQPPS